MITGLLLGQEGWKVSRSQVERLRKIEGLKVPPRQPKRARLWLVERSCIRLRPERRIHVWSGDFVMDPTDGGRLIKMLTQIDEFTKEARAIYPARRIRAADVIDSFADVMIERGVPELIRSDNGQRWWRRSSGSGSPGSARGRSKARPAARGRMATARASTASSGNGC
jgi:putative transposase